MNALESIEQLNSVEYIYLRNLTEPRDNSLSIVVEEASVDKGRTAEAPSEELRVLYSNAHPIESVPGCKTFELYWKHYVAYCVTEELVGSNARSGYDDELFDGKILRVYTESHFLDHIQRDTGCHSSPVLHYKLVCLNHLIDVAAYESPEVHLLAR